MADEKKTETLEEGRVVAPFPVSASPDALVGENSPTKEVEIAVEDRVDDALLSDKPPEPVTEVPVYEVVVNTDERVRYVIVPPEGRGDATLPIHALVGAKTVEEVFDAAASKQDEPASDEERADAASKGTTPRERAAAKKS